MAIPFILLALGVASGATGATLGVHSVVKIKRVIFQRRKRSKTMLYVGWQYIVRKPLPQRMSLEKWK